MEGLLKKIENKTAVIAIIGLGYTGLSLTHDFGLHGFKVIGYDIDKEKITSFKKRENYLPDLPLPKISKLVREKRFIPTCHTEDLNEADIKIICVPTPLNHQRQPELSYLQKAIDTAAHVLKKGQLIIIQSTSFPGTTEELALPLIEKVSQLKGGKDFYLAHVPEWEEAGNPQAVLSQIPRLCGGLTPKCTKLACVLYETITVRVHACPSTKIAEAAKIFENTYRLINIAFVNEMKIAFEQMDINIWDVIEAASTKPFGYIPFYPGDCIPIDPIYPPYCAREFEASTTMIENALKINDKATRYVVEKVQDALNSVKKSIKGSKILILGIAPKKDISDIREAPALKILPSLEELGAKIAYNDPFVPQLKEPKLISTPLSELPKFDCVVVISNHSQYNWEKICERANLVVDTRNAMAHVPKNLKKKVFL